MSERRASYRRARLLIFLSLFPLSPTSQQVVRNTLHSASPSAGPSTSQAPSSPKKPSTSQLPSSSQSQPASTPIHPDSHKLFYSDVVFAETGLEVSDLIFCALMSGGDYATGMMNVGIKTAKALADCGFGGKLVEGIEEHKEDERELERFVKEWRKEVVEELKTNSQGRLSTRKHKIAQELEADTSFPDLKIVNYYTHPAVSTGLPPPTWDTEPKVPDLIAFLSSTFEWSNAEIEMYCRNLLYPGLAMQALRKSALQLDSTIPRPPSSISSASPFLHSISDLKTSSSTKHLPSYRLQLSTTHFTHLITSHLPSPDPFPIPSDPDLQVVGRRKQQVEEVKGEGPWRHWVPRELIEGVEEGRRLVREWERGVERKKEKKGRVSGWAGASKAGVGRKKGKGKGKVVDSDATVTSTEEEDSASVARPPIKSKSKPSTSTTARRRRLETASTSAPSSSDNESGRAPPPPKSPRKSKEQQSPFKIKRKEKGGVKKQTSWIEISSSEEEELPTPKELARLVFPAASTSAAGSKKTSSSSHSYIPPSPAPSRNTSLTTSKSLNHPLPSSSSSRNPTAAAPSQPRKGLLPFSSTKPTSSHRTKSKIVGGGGPSQSKSRSISIDSEEDGVEDEMLLSLDEALRRSRKAREGGAAAGRGGRRVEGKGKEREVPRTKSLSKGRVEELVLSDSD